MTPQPLPLPSPALLKWELQLHNPVQPVIMAPPPTTMVEVYDRLAAQENLDSARRAEFERRVGIDPNQARLDALATLTAAAGPLTDIHNPQPINGGATAWGGGTVGSTNPTTRTMTLGYHGYPEGKPVGAPGGGGGGSTDWDSDRETGQGGVERGEVGLQRDEQVA